jgi:ATP synthase protein I
MSEDPKRGADWVRLSGLGVELVGAVAGFTLLGYWWDRHFETAPWGLVICIGLGLIGGMYNLIRRSLAASKEEAVREAKSTDGDKKR